MCLLCLHALGWVCICVCAAAFRCVSPRARPSVPVDVGLLAASIHLPYSFTLQSTAAPRMLPAKHTNKCTRTHMETHTIPQQRHFFHCGFSSFFSLLIIATVKGLTLNIKLAVCVCVRVFLRGRARFGNPLTFLVSLCARAAFTRCF